MTTVDPPLHRHQSESAHGRDDGYSQSPHPSTSSFRIDISARNNTQASWLVAANLLKLAPTLGEALP